MTNYDNMLRANQNLCEEKKILAIDMIHRMLKRNEHVSVMDLTKATGLSRSYFYKNEQVRTELYKAIEAQQGKVLHSRTQMMGLDTSEYSFGYISGWSGDKEVSELKENLDIIKQTADKISLSIEECVKKLKKDRDMYQMVSEDRLQYAEPNHKKR